MIGAVRAGADGAVPGLAVADTLKRVDDVAGRRDRRPRRPGRGADPAGVPRPASCAPRTLPAADATDDAALVEAIGGTVVVVPGEPRNLKITGPADLMIAAALLRDVVTS